MNVLMESNQPEEVAHLKEQPHKGLIARDERVRRKRGSLGSGSSQRTDSESSSEIISEVTENNNQTNKLEQSYDINDSDNDKNKFQANDNATTIHLLQELIHRRSQLKEMDRCLFTMISKCLSQLDSEEQNRINRLINWVPLESCNQQQSLINNTNHGSLNLSDISSQQRPIQYHEVQTSSDVNPMHNQDAIDLSVNLNSGLSYNQLIGEEKVSTPSTASTSNPLNTWLRHSNHINCDIIASTSNQQDVPMNCSTEMSPGFSGPRRPSTSSSVFNFRKSRLLDGISLKSANFEMPTAQSVSMVDDIETDGEDAEINGKRNMNCENDTQNEFKKTKLMDLQKISTHGVSTQQEQQQPMDQMAMDPIRQRLFVQQQQIAHLNMGNIQFSSDQLKHIMQQNEINLNLLTRFGNSSLMQQNHNIHNPINPINEQLRLNHIANNNFIEKILNGGTTTTTITTTKDLQHDPSQGFRSDGDSNQQDLGPKQPPIDYELLARLSCDQQKLLAHQCHVCGSGFEDRHRLQQHLSIHLNLHPTWFEEKTIKETMVQYESKRGDYLCKICSIRYETTTEFDKHMQIHGDKPHSCDLCLADSKNVSFRFYRQLLTHLRSHCFLYCCRFVPDCKQKANRKDYLKLHILKHHLNNKLPECYTICCH